MNLDILAQYIYVYNYINVHIYYSEEGALPHRNM